MPYSFDFNNSADFSEAYTFRIDGQKNVFGRDGLRPFWVADMSFKCHPAITEALQKIVDTKAYVYNIVPEEYKQSIIDWLYKIQGWKIEEEWLSFIPGVVRGISYAIQHFTSPGDKIIIQPPVYHPFRLLTQNNGREVVNMPLIRSEHIESGAHASDIYRMDLEALRKLKKDECKMMILCNPHNPGGIVWNKEVLKELADICYEKNIIVISDEIHADIPLWGGKHIPFATISDKAAQISITYGAPSKTFNVAGIASSYIVIPNPDLRTKFYKYLTVNEYSSPTIFASVAAIASYTYGNPWRLEMIKYLEANYKYVLNHCIKNNLPINPIAPDASFLVWLDCRKMGLSQPDLVKYFVEEKKIALNDGSVFGPGGEGFMRLNIGCPLSNLS